MPELPEIEHLKRSLGPILLGTRVGRVELRRAEIVRNIGLRPTGSRIKGSELLAGTTIRALARHGKELAIVADRGRALCVHLGMSGNLRWYPRGARLQGRDHVHCIWRLDSPRAGPGRLVLRDPRRFGGLWSFPSLRALRAQRWSGRGPDALAIDTRTLRRRLARTRRPVKAALLDQSILAGIGNIYADEVLFAAGIHPLTHSACLPAERVRVLAGAIRRILRSAIAAGGSTIRDFRDGDGRPGTYRRKLRVYGRCAEPCFRCMTPLRPVTVAQRTSVFCPACQPATRRR